MTTTLIVPTPPPWLDLDSIVPEHSRRDVFEMTARIRSGEVLTVEEMNKAVDLADTVSNLELGAASSVESEDFRVGDAIYAVLDEFCGTLKLTAAMHHYVRAHPALEDTRFDPDRHLSEEPKPYPVTH